MFVGDDPTGTFVKGMSELQRSGIGFPNWSIDAGVGGRAVEISMV